MRKADYIYVLIALLLLIFSLPVRSEVSSYQLKDAIKLGQKYLTAKIASDEYYLNCKSNNLQVPCPVSSSGKIIPAYYMINMFSIDNSVTQEIRNQIIKMLNHESKDFLWGYSLNSPADLDDTSLAMQTLILLGIPQNIAILTPFHNRKMNAYSTFANQINPKPITDPSVENNVGIHPEINASAYNLFHMLNLSTKINYNLLVKFQTKQGYWPGYFYSGHFYSTYLNMKLLCAARPQSKQTLLGLQFIKSSQHANGSWGNPANAYDTALALNTLLDCGAVAGVEKGTIYLLSQQNDKGYWTTETSIWSYKYKDFPAIVWFAYDDQHVLTTALSLSALKKYLMLKNL
jgi:hypothetical protein